MNKLSSLRVASVKFRKKVLNRVTPQELKASDISPRETVRTIQRILARFAAEVREEPDESLKLNFLDNLNKFQSRLDKELAKLEAEATKKKKRSREEALQDIQKVLNDLEQDIRQDEQKYSKLSRLALDRKTGNTLSTEEWLDQVEDWEDIRPPPHEMTNYDFFMGTTQDGPHTSVERVETKVETAAEVKAKKQRWMGIIEWANAQHQEWRNQEVPSFNPDSTKWIKGRLLGRGTYGAVSAVGIVEETFKIGDKAKSIIVVKQVPFEGKENEDRQRVLDQCRALQKVDRHPHVVSILALSSSDAVYNIYMEYVSGGNLSGMLRYIKGLTEDELKPIIKQIAEGLQHLHSLGFVHRDLKGANVLMTLGGCAKICDLDTLKDTARAEQKVLGGYGTPAWMAPEAAQGNFSARSDVWSLGCIVIELLTAKDPWCLDVERSSGDITLKLQKMNTEKKVRGPPLGDARDKLSRLGRAALGRIFVHIEPRISVTTFLKHPWLREDPTHPDNLELSPLIEEDIDDLLTPDDE